MSHLNEPHRDMDRTERFYKIELLLRSRGSVSFADLVAELEVSRATLKRDLQYLRDRLGAPIAYDTSSNCYRLGVETAAAGTPARHELPGLWFSENEIHALLTMQQLLAGLDDDGVLARHLQPLTEKLQGMLGTDANESRELLRRVKVIGTALAARAEPAFRTAGQHAGAPPARVAALL
jgi:predicted DNA-binding transcriptional regulator YafY